MRCKLYIEIHVIVVINLHHKFRFIALITTELAKLQIVGWSVTILKRKRSRLYYIYYCFVKILIRTTTIQSRMCIYM